MPYQHGNTPKWIYRVDHRRPEDVFTNGFRPWGELRDFFLHILGFSLSSELPYAQRSGFISASDSPDSALRFFGSGLLDPIYRTEYNEIYLYQIAANEHTYSALRTASNYLARIMEGTITFSSGDSVLAQNAIHAVFNEFAYQREWFNDGPIAPTRVHSAWRVDSLPVNPLHVRFHDMNTVYYLPRIHDEEITNDNYLELGTLANELPFEHDAPISSPVTVNVPDSVLESDAAGGVGASLGFACSPDFEPTSKRFKRALATNPKPAPEPAFARCYLEKKLVHQDLHKTGVWKPFVTSLSKPTPFYLLASKSHLPYQIVWDDIVPDQTNQVYAKQFQSTHRKPLGHDLVYDQYQRFSINPDKNKITYAITMQKDPNSLVFGCEMQLGAINDPFQKFIYQPIDRIGGDFLLFRILSTAVSDYSLHLNHGVVNKKTNGVLFHPLVFANYHSNESLLEEVFLVVHEEHFTAAKALLKQKSNSSLVDLTLTWFYGKQHYCFNPLKNSSYAHAPLRKRFFYDLQTYQINYVDANHKLYALYNKRDVSSRWDWVTWNAYDPHLVNDKRLQWYFVNQKWEGNFYHLNWRNIRSLFNNDWLRVVVYGPNWGGLYTSNSYNELNSLAIFSLASTVDL